MKIKIYKGSACGKVAAPPSKSMAHRLLIAAAMCEGESTVRRLPLCEDVLATLDCLGALGVKTELCGEDIKVYGIDFRKAAANAPLHCRESGSTMRFMIPLALLSGNELKVTGKSGLLARPMTVFEDLAKEHSLKFLKNEDGYTVKGPLKAGEYSLPGNVSSQFITGLMLALSSLEGDSRIKITGSLESRSYLELTRAALSVFGVKVVWENDMSLYVRGGQRFVPRDVTVEGDYSGAAFLLALNRLGGDVEVCGLDKDSLQGDRVADELLCRLDAKNAEIDITDCPDLGPILFATASARFGATFTGTRRLKIKESDRAAAMAEELSKLGVKVSVFDNTVTVEGGGLTAPNEELSGHGDHRIVMSLAVLLTLTGGVVSGAEAITKSYPDFFEHLTSLGIRCEIID